MKFKLSKSTVSKRKLLRMRYKVFIKSQLHKQMGILEDLLLALVDDMIEIH